MPSRPDFAAEFTKWFAENVFGAARAVGGAALLERMYELGAASRDGEVAAARAEGAEEKLYRSSQMANYTPAQIASAEKWLAEKVMGWHEHLPPYYRKGDEVWARNTDKHVRHAIALRNWHPCSDPSHAAMCREKAREKRMRDDHYMLHGPHLVICWKFSGEGKVAGYAESSNESLASSVALARALGWKE